MDSVFAWFHNSSGKPDEATKFYEKLLGWRPAEGPPGMTMFAGAAGPFAAVGAAEHDAPTAWIPYVQVEDVDAITRRAVKLGAQVIQERTHGPAGDFAIVKDPGGAPIALWQKG